MANALSRQAPPQQGNAFSYPMGPYRGFQSFGNVDPLNRPVLHNADGSYSTSSSATRYDPRDGTATIFPTVIGGKRLTEDEAWAHYMKTGEHMGKFRMAPAGSPEPQNAFAWAPSEAYSQMVHEWQASHYDEHGNRK